MSFDHEETAESSMRVRTDPRMAASVRSAAQHRPVAAVGLAVGLEQAIGPVGVGDRGRCRGPVEQAADAAA